MLYYYVILLAVCFNVIQAGPLPGKDARIPRHVIPRYTNGTFAPPSITPESAQPESAQPESASPTSTVLIPSSNEPLSTVTPTARSSTAKDKSATFGGEDQQGAGHLSSHITMAPEQRVSSTSESTTTSSTPSMNTPAPSYPGKSASDLASATSEDAFEAFQSARSAQVSGNPGAPSSGYQAHLISISQPQTATASLTSNDQRDQITSFTGATTTAPGQPSVETGSSISSMPSAEQVQSSSTPAILPSSSYGVGTPGASQLTNSMSASSDFTSTGLPEITLARTTAETTSPLVQVPSTLLGTVRPSTPTSGSSSTGRPSSSAKPQYAYPDASAGNVAMSQGYNSIFQGLTPESPCDPSNSQQASACVDGQPGKCELTGTYALQSCKSGFSCFAMPLPGGQSGVNIGCYDPNVAHHALQNDGTDASSTSDSGQTSAGAIASFPTANPTSTKAVSPEVASSSAISSPLAAAAAAAATTGAATSPSSVADSKAEVTSAALSTPTPTSGRAKLEQGMQDQNHVQAAPDQAKQPQPTSSLDSSPASTSEATSGVQLSFPDNAGIGSTVGQDRETESHDSKEDPPSNQKNVVQNDGQNVSSSPAVPPSATAVTAAPTAGITAAPAIGAGNAKGFITVTVTQTTPMHD